MTESVNIARLESEVWSQWDWAMESLYGKLYDIMEQSGATLDQMVNAIQKYCDWETADGFREWCNEE